MPFHLGRHKRNHPRWKGMFIYMEQHENSPPEKQPSESLPPDKPPRKESLYDMIPLSKKQLDVIIAVLVVALLLFIVIGALVGNGII